MKDKLPPNIEKCRHDHPFYVKAPEGSIEGFFMIPYANDLLAVISGCGEGWDHVSVSLRYRCPTWDEMCFIKRLFFKSDEIVIQFHPPAAKHINICEYVLHLWRPWNQEFELPPEWMLK